MALARTVAAVRKRQAAGGGGETPPDDWRAARETRVVLDGPLEAVLWSLDDFGEDVGGAVPCRVARRYMPDVPALLAHAVQTYPTREAAWTAAITAELALVCCHGRGRYKGRVPCALVVDAASGVAVDVPTELRMAWRSVAERLVLEVRKIEGGFVLSECESEGDAGSVAFVDANGRRREIACLELLLQDDIVGPLNALLSFALRVKFLTWILLKELALDPVSELNTNRLQAAPFHMEYGSLALVYWPECLARLADRWDEGLPAVIRRLAAVRRNEGAEAMHARLELGASPLHCLSTPEMRMRVCQGPFKPQADDACWHGFVPREHVDALWAALMACVRGNGLDKDTWEAQTLQGVNVICMETAMASDLRQARHLENRGEADKNDDNVRLAIDLCLKIFCTRKNADDVGVWACGVIRRASPLTRILVMTPASNQDIFLRQLHISTCIMDYGADTTVKQMSQRVLELVTL